MNTAKIAHMTHLAGRRFLLGILLISVLYCLFFLLLVPKYATNDDVKLTMIASGTSIVSRPDEHLLFTNVIAGQILKRLYIMGPDVPWYGIYIFSVHAVSTFCLLYCIASSGLSLTRFVFFLSFFLIVQMKFLIDPQFTTTAFMAALSGVFMFACSLQDEKTNAGMLTASGVLLFISSLIRMEMLMLTSLLFLPMLVMETKGNCSGRKKVISVFFIGITAIAAFGAYRYNAVYYYCDPRWKGFYEMNGLRAQITDYGSVVYNSETKRHFDEVGWSRNDYLMFSNWFFADKALYAPERQSGLLSHFKNRWRWKPFSEAAPPIKKMLGDPSFLLMTGLAVTGLFYCRGRRHLEVIAPTFILTAALIGYMAFFMKLPSRVYSPIAAFLAFQAVFFVNKSIDLQSPMRARRWLGAATILLLLLLSFVRVYACYTAADTRLANRNSLIDMLDNLRSPGRLVVSIADSFPFEMALLPFDSLKKFRGLDIYWTGYILNTPLPDVQLERFGITDIYTALYMNDNLVLVSRRELLALYATFVKEHYDHEIDFKIYSGNDLFVICKPFLKPGRL